MHGVVSARTQFKLGDFFANVEFKDGDIVHGIPASIITKDPRVQMAIEMDKRMFGKIIFLEWKSGGEEKKGTGVSNKKSLTLEDVRSIEDVKQYLIENHGVARNISSVDKIKAKVEEFNLVFPNFSFE